MWRTILNSTVIIFILVTHLSHLNTAPVYQNYGVYPSVLKSTRVCPVYKGKGDRDDVTNYRPKTNDLLTDNQYAYRQNRTTTMAATKIFDCVVTGLDDRYKMAARGPRYTISNGQDMGKPFVEVRNGTYHGSGPREEARAMCSVKTLEVNATANATITRRLHGVVTSRELHSSIQRLEVIIFGQMQQLWQSLDAIRLHLGGEAPLPDRRTVMFRFKPEA